MIFMSLMGVEPTALMFAKVAKALSYQSLPTSGDPRQIDHGTNLLLLYNDYFFRIYLNFFIRNKNWPSFEQAMRQYSARLCILRTKLGHYFSQRIIELFISSKKRNFCIAASDPIIFRFLLPSGGAALQPFREVRSVGKLQGRTQLNEKSQ